MTETPASFQLPPPMPKRRFRWAFLSQFLLVASLIASNVATVVSDQVHQVAFDLFERVASVAGDAVADRLLSQSPTRLRRAEVERVARPLRAERDAVRVERDLALSRRRALELELDAARATALAAAGERDAARATAAAAAGERDAVRAMAARRAAAVQKVVRTATTKIGLRSTEALASFPARAVPYAGVVALVGFTGYELQVDCDLAKSLAQLNLEHDNEKIDVGLICSRVNELPEKAERAWADVKAKVGASAQGMYEDLRTRFPALRATPAPAAPASAPSARMTSSASP